MDETEAPKVLTDEDKKRARLEKLRASYKEKQAKKQLEVKEESAEMLKRLTLEKDLKERQDALLKGELMLQNKHIEKLEARLAKRIQALQEDEERETRVKEAVIKAKPQQPVKPADPHRSLIDAFIKGGY